MIIYIVSLLRPKIKVTALRLTRPSLYLVCLCISHIKTSNRHLRPFTLKPQILHYNNQHIYYTIMKMS